MKYLDIQKDLVKRYHINLDPDSKCWSRMHVHVRERRVCKWRYKNSFKATFDLMHEIGHIQTSRPNLRRCEDEYLATQWALDHLDDYGLEMDINIMGIFQDYIDREYDRGVRRHCKTLPPRESLRLKHKGLENGLFMPD